MTEIESRFIGNFKTGDNINHNLEVLAFLYAQFNAGNERQKRLLCKPITVMLVSIIDAVLHDLHYRVKTFTAEGVTNILEESLNYIRSLKKIDDLGKYIDSARKHKLLGDDAQLYKDLDDLRRLRNRIHIQNAKKDFEPDEFVAFNEVRKSLAENALEKTLRVMAEKYSRQHDYVGNFVLPWGAQ